MAAEEADVTTYYKATRPDGTSFYDGKTQWRMGRITRVDGEKRTRLCGRGILHASDAPGETLVGGSWPCRLFVVEERSPIVAKEGHKVGAHAWKVEAELPAWQALGPNGEQVAALIERCRTLTADEARKLAAARDAARDAAWDAAWGAAMGAARDAAWDAAWGAAMGAAWDAALALVVRDVLPTKHFDVLYGPWAKVIGDVA